MNYIGSPWPPLECTLSLASCRLRAESLARRLHCRLWAGSGFQSSFQAAAAAAAAAANTDPVGNSKPNPVNGYGAHGLINGHWCGAHNLRNFRTYDSLDGSDSDEIDEDEIVVKPPQVLKPPTRVINETHPILRFPGEHRNHSEGMGSVLLHKKLVRIADDLGQNSEETSDTASDTSSDVLRYDDDAYQGRLYRGLSYEAGLDKIGLTNGDDLLVVDAPEHVSDDDDDVYLPAMDYSLNGFAKNVPSEKFRESVQGVTSVTEGRDEGSSLRYNGTTSFVSTNVNFSDRPNIKDQQTDRSEQCLGHFEKALSSSNEVLNPEMKSEASSELCISPRYFQTGLYGIEEEDDRKGEEASDESTDEGVESDDEPHYLNNIVGVTKGNDEKSGSSDEETDEEDVFDDEACSKLPVDKRDNDCDSVNVLPEVTNTNDSSTYSYSEDYCPSEEVDCDDDDTVSKCVSKTIGNHVSEVCDFHIDNEKEDSGVHVNETIKQAISKTGILSTDKERECDIGGDVDKLHNMNLSLDSVRGIASQGWLQQESKEEIERKNGAISNINRDGLFEENSGTGETESKQHPRTYAVFSARTGLDLFKDQSEQVEEEKEVDEEGEEEEEGDKVITVKKEPISTNSSLYEKDSVESLVTESKQLLKAKDPCCFGSRMSHDFDDILESNDDINISLSSKVTKEWEQHAVNSREVNDNVTVSKIEFPHEDSNKLRVNDRNVFDESEGEESLDDEDETVKNSVLEFIGETSKVTSSPVVFGGRISQDLDAEQAGSKNFTEDQAEGKTTSIVFAPKISQGIESEASEDQEVGENTELEQTTDKEIRKKTASIFGPRLSKDIESEESEEDSEEDEIREEGAFNKDSEHTTTKEITEKTASIFGPRLCQDIESEESEEDSEEDETGVEGAFSKDSKHSATKDITENTTSVFGPRLSQDSESEESEEYSEEDETGGESAFNKDLELTTTKEIKEKTASIFGPRLSQNIESEESEEDSEEDEIGGRGGAFNKDSNHTTTKEITEDTASIFGPRLSQDIESEESEEDSEEDEIGEGAFNKDSKHTTTKEITQKTASIFGPRLSQDIESEISEEESGEDSDSDTAPPKEPTLSLTVVKDKESDNFDNHTKTTSEIETKTDLTAPVKFGGRVSLDFEVDEKSEDSDEEEEIEDEASSLFDDETHHLSRPPIVFGSRISRDESPEVCSRTALEERGATSIFGGRISRRDSYDDKNFAFDLDDSFNSSRKPKQEKTTAVVTNNELAESSQALSSPVCFGGRVSQELDDSDEVETNYLHSLTKQTLTLGSRISHNLNDEYEKKELEMNEDVLEEDVEETREKQTIFGRRISREFDDDECVPRRKENKNIIQTEEGEENKDESNVGKSRDEEEERIDNINFSAAPLRSAVTFGSRMHQDWEDDDEEDYSRLDVQPVDDDDGAEEGTSLSVFSPVTFGKRSEDNFNIDDGPVYETLDDLLSEYKIKDDDDDINESENILENICGLELTSNDDIPDESPVTTPEVVVSNRFKFHVTPVSDQDHFDSLQSGEWLQADQGLSKGSALSTLQSQEDEDDDERYRRILLRSTSLKSGKTPPGTPRRKKIVRFADALGLDLEAVRHIVTDDIPVVPASAFMDLKLEPPAPSPSISAPVLFSSRKCLCPQFSQPGSEKRFIERVKNQKVCLENVVVSTMDIYGVVRVLNCSFHKSVVVRYTLDEWQSHCDISATYIQGSSDGFSDRFQFSLQVPGLRAGDRVVFAVRFTAEGEELWDNNDGKDYALRCMTVSRLDEKSDPSDKDLFSFV